MNAVQSDQPGPRSHTVLDGAAEFWVREADRWDGTSGQFGLAMLEAANLAQGQRVLDVGCGAGSTTVDAAQRVVPGLAVGIDISGPALALARQRARAAGVSNIEFLEADAGTHEFDAGTFDAVISRFGSMFFTDPVSAFGNLRRSLRPGGTLSIVAWQGPLESDWTTVAVHAAITVFGRPPDLGAPHDPGPFAFADSDHLRGVVEASGFVDIALQSLTRSMVVGKDVDDAVRLVTETPQAKALFAGQPLEKIDAAIHALQRGFDPFATTTGVLTKGKAWLLTARR